MADSPFCIDVTASNFDEVVLERSRQKPVLVDFWADWCAPCKMLAPILTKLAQEYDGKFELAKVNTDAEQSLAMEYQIRSLPTVKLFKDAKPEDEFMGALPESEVRKFLDRYVENEADAILHKARALQTAGKDNAAQELLRRAIATAPGDDRLHLELATMEISAGEVVTAQQTMAAVSRKGRNDPQYQTLRSKLDFVELSVGAPENNVLQSRLQADPGDLEARHQLGARLLLADDAEGAMEQFLEIVRRDRSFREDAGRSALIKTFNLLGGNHPAVKRYRGLLARLLN